MKILILYNIASKLNFGKPSDLICEKEIEIIVPIIQKILKKNGHTVETLITDLNLWENLKIKKSNIDLVLNLAEAFGGGNTDESLVPAMLEALNIPYTGASAANMNFTFDKEKTKTYLSTFGIRTPKHILVNHLNEILEADISFPVIVKPVRAEASIGIYFNNVVLNYSDLKLKVNECITIYKQPAIVEKFIFGREITVGIIGNKGNLKIFPPLEFLFPEAINDNEKIRSYENKWGGKKEIMIEADLDEEVKELLFQHSRIAFLKCNCRDYARVDFRIDKANIPYFLEINYNPGIGPNTHGLNNSLTMTASFVNLSFSEFIELIIQTAFNRYNL